MLHNNIFKTITLSAVTLVSAFTALALTYQLPKAHRSEHSSLIAKQENVGNQVSVKETQEFLDNLFKTKRSLKSTSTPRDGIHAA